MLVAVSVAIPWEAPAPEDVKIRAFASGLKTPFCVTFMLQVVLTDELNSTSAADTDVGI
ncbi:MAG: hypothetical protein U5K75_11335 [Ahrensia sp.]|nr:hypothetical protein [Ahrensia sp.]